MSDNPAGISTRDLKRRIRAMEEAVKDPETRETIPSAELRREIAAKQGRLAVTGDFGLSEADELSLTLRAKREVFDDLWRTACGKYGDIDYDHYDEDGRHTPYYLNTLWLTYEEAMATYSKWSNSNTLREKYWGAKIRTNIPQPLRDGVNAESAFYLSTIEVVNLSSTTNWVRVSGIYMFRCCLKLRIIMTPLESVGWNSRDLEQCNNLEEVKIKVTQNKDIHLEGCPKLSLESFDYLVEKCETKKGFTVLVHKGVYSKLTDPDNAEWFALLEAAAAKNISFATT